MLQNAVAASTDFPMAIPKSKFFFQVDWEREARSAAAPQCFALTKGQPGRDL